MEDINLPAAGPEEATPPFQTLMWLRMYLRLRVERQWQ